ncbi:hypothetical protein FB451DRAFT_1171305 [Mycena latifolia]|nr:hypothetical protein FB451DRAFT_1171305 [Mycena latifolia]
MPTIQSKTRAGKGRMGSGAEEWMVWMDTVDRKRRRPNKSGDNDREPGNEEVARSQNENQGGGYICSAHADAQKCHHKTLPKEKMHRTNHVRSTAAQSCQSRAVMRLLEIQRSRKTVEGQNEGGKARRQRVQAAAADTVRIEAVSIFCRTRVDESTTRKPSHNPKPSFEPYLRARYFLFPRFWNAEDSNLGARCVGHSSEVNPSDFSFGKISRDARRQLEGHHYTFGTAKEIEPPCPTSPHFHAIDAFDDPGLQNPNMNPHCLALLARDPRSESNFTYVFGAQSVRGRQEGARPKALVRLDFRGLAIIGLYFLIVDDVICGVGLVTSFEQCLTGQASRKGINNGYTVSDSLKNYQIYIHNTFFQFL